MRSEVIETAKTVEIAINSACEKLGFNRSDVEWEIMDLPGKIGFFGLKTRPAKVKVWIETPDEVVKEVNLKIDSKNTTFSKELSEASEIRKVISDDKVCNVVDQKSKSEFVHTSKNWHNKSTNFDKSIEMNEDVNKKINLALSFLANICTNMKLQATFNTVVVDGGISINIEGEGLGVIIGRRGETLDALQYLAGLVANRVEGEYLRFTLDCGDYRKKRMNTLEALAKKISETVVKTKVTKTLEPMNPFERRVIHATVSEIKGVKSTSIGVEPSRRVVISVFNDSHTDNISKSKPTTSDYKRNSSRRGPPQHREPRSSTLGGTINTIPQVHPRPDSLVNFDKAQNNNATKPSSSPKKVLEATSEPLYTKLDLE